MKNASIPTHLNPCRFEGQSEAGTSLYSENGIFSSIYSSIRQYERFRVELIYRKGVIEGADMKQTYEAGPESLYWSCLMSW